MFKSKIPKKSGQSDEQGSKTQLRILSPLVPTKIKNEHPIEPNIPTKTRRSSLTTPTPFAPQKSQ